MSLPLKALWTNKPTRRIAAKWTRQGLACAHDFGPSVAAVAEVSVDEATGKIRVHHITSAMDCGLMINSDGAKAQMEGNAVWGVSATLTEEVRIENGRVALNNFETYPLLTMKEAPTAEAILVIQAGRNRQAWANRLLVRLGQRSPMPFFTDWQTVEKYAFETGVKDWMAKKDPQVIVIGTGVGGLTAASLLLKAGFPVTVLEANVYTGGSAGTFFHKGFRFDAGATLAGGFSPGGSHA